MASFGRLAVSAITGSVENTAALLNLNFDFSLVKLVAPKEFEGVGSALSSRRRVEAESGRTHTTARKLAALFDPSLPNTPELLRAYGERASEISQSPLAQAADASTTGLFAQHAGGDYTSLWAAATSGPGAIKVHLLACMLARIWDAGEATSIWVEFVEFQKRHIISHFMESGNISTSAYFAAQQEVTREQLAEWDSSARAWLQTADLVKKKQQTQLDLILNNLNIPVSNRRNVYDSVINTWRTSLQGMEDLISGKPHILQSGELLLGLSSWHIYPDLFILDARNTTVTQQDPLVKPFGVLTIGLQGPGSAEGQGFNWSLPLSRLRYYGDPVMTTRSSGDNSRLTVEEFLLVILGSCINPILPSFLRRDRVDNETAQSVARYIVEIYGYFYNLHVSEFLSSSNWFYMLVEASQLFLMSGGSARLKNLTLINLGVRSSHKFLPKLDFPMLGLDSIVDVLSICTNTETRIKLLRKEAETLNVSSEDLIIIHKRVCICRGAPFQFYEYATAALHRPNPRGNPIGQQNLPARHLRWVYSPCMCNPEGLPSSPETVDLGSAVPDSVAVQESRDSILIFSDFIPGPIREYFGYQSRDAALVLHSGIWSCPQFRCNGCVNGDNDIGLFIRHHETPEWARSQEFDAHFEMDNNNAMLEDRIETLLSLLKTGALNIAKLPGKLTQVLLRSYGLGDSWREGKPKYESYLTELQLLASIVDLYQSMSNVTINVRVLQTSLKPLVDDFQVHVNGKLAITNEYKPGNNNNASPEALRAVFGPHRLSRTQAFTSICFMESGRHIFEISTQHSSLQDVMAISAGDSIYVASPLITDPSWWSDHRCDTITRIAGNVGKPGISLLVSPHNLKKPRNDINNWKVINHSAFDGDIRDCFGGTSLHLSLTGAVQPLQRSDFGTHDAEMNFVEAVVSVLDRGEWIADIDILKTVERRMSVEAILSPKQTLIWRHFFTISDTNHIKLDPNAKSMVWCHPKCYAGYGPLERKNQSKQAPDESLITLQNWPEVITAPSGDLVFLAHGNWQARIAAVSILSLIYPTDEVALIVYPEKICQQCLAPGAYLESKAQLDLAVAMIDDKWYQSIRIASKRGGLEGGVWNSVTDEKRFIQELLVSAYFQHKVEIDLTNLNLVNTSVERKARTHGEKIAPRIFIC
ncbi:hypothetical protein TWF694_001874 [Orbilia ellipsospora]|uniref:Uncharacterized protein n=1 Tax=Orbilia ellipsospora TaxID=2528407 RepID=A0AAV9X4Z6_9PEZI